jgi:hypothetical protein
VIENGNFRGEHGTAGEPGYLLIGGTIKEDGTAKLSAVSLPTRVRTTATTSKPSSKTPRVRAPGTRVWALLVGPAPSTSRSNRQFVAMRPQRAGPRLRMDWCATFSKSAQQHRAAIPDVRSLTLPHFPWQLGRGFLRYTHEGNSCGSPPCCLPPSP